MRKYKDSSEAKMGAAQHGVAGGKEERELAKWENGAGVGKMGKRGRLSRNSERVRKGEKCCGRREQRRGGRYHVDPGRGCP